MQTKIWLQSFVVLIFVALVGENFGFAQNAQLKAEFSWKMEERTGPSYVFPGGRTDVRGHIPNIREYVNPRNGYKVSFDASKTRPVGGRRIVAYYWRIVGPSGVFRRNGRQISLNLKQGQYSVSLSVIDIRGNAGFCRGKIKVRDILIVSLGDSYSSGEGNPHRHAGFLSDPIWAPGGNVIESEKNYRAARSIYSAPAQAAWMLEREDPHTSVTFISLAWTGAQIRHMISETRSFVIAGEYPRRFETVTVPSQVDELLQLITDRNGRQRNIDRLFIGAGGNDIFFSKILIELMDLPVRGIGFDKVSRAIQLLPIKFLELNRYLTSRLNIPHENIYLTSYPDIFAGEQYRDIGVTVWGDITVEEIDFVKREVFHPLNETMRFSSLVAGWNFVDLSETLDGHGVYLSRDPWVVTWNEAIDRQGYDYVSGIASKGMFHPNEKGHYSMAKKIREVAFGNSFEKILDRGLKIVSINKTISVPQVNGSPRPQPIETELNVRFSHAIDRSTFNEFDIELYGPRGNLIQAEVIGTDDPKEFVVVFGRTMTGQYSISIGPFIRDLQGRHFDQKQNGVEWEISSRSLFGKYTGNFKVQMRGGGTEIASPDLVADPSRNKPINPDPFARIREFNRRNSGSQIRGFGGFRR